VGCIKEVTFTRTVVILEKLLPGKKVGLGGVVVLLEQTREEGEGRAGQGGYEAQKKGKLLREDSCRHHGDR
jgi:hypothetical protein